MLSLFVLSSLFFWFFQLYLKFTEAVARPGGTYIEGMVGQPRFVNPLLSQSSDADGILSRLVYSSLLKHDEAGELVNDLAESYEVSEDKQVYTVKIKDNVRWHDGKPLTADDVFFTLKVLKDPAYKSPLRLNWQGVEIEQLDQRTIKFILKMPYFGFLEDLTVGILPKHIWQNIQPENFLLAEANLKPIGSGPYAFLNFSKDSSGYILSYELKSFEDYYGGAPFIQKINFNFYPDENSAIEAYNRKEIDGISNVSAENLSRIKNQKGTVVYNLSVPRYYAVFFNQTKSVALADDAVREALAWGVDRGKIITEVLGGKGKPVYGPLLPQMSGYERDIATYDYNPSKARELLEEKGWKANEEGVREKGGQKLEFEILTLDWPSFAKTADLISENWKDIGVRARVNVLSFSDLQQNYIRPREYQALLFGQALNFDPDLYFFWHSSEKKDPGNNWSLFDDKKVDELLEKARQELDRNKRDEYYREIQKIITKEIPAIFLYSPDFIFIADHKLRGVDTRVISSSADRFGSVNKWYVKTKRIWHWKKR